MTNEQAALKEKILTILSPQIDEAGLKIDQISDDDDLTELGILDSVAFLEFIGTLESEYQISIDFSELDPSEFTSIKGLIQNLSP